MRIIPIKVDNYNYSKFNEFDQKEEVNVKTPSRFAAVLTLGMSVLSIPSLAIAQTNIDVVDTAQLFARGVGVLVSVEISCVTTTNDWSVDVTIFQRAGSKTTIGSGFINGGSTNNNCSSTPTQVDVPVTASGRIFKKGVAAASANIFECDANGCNSNHETKEIQILTTQ